ncbi:MAG: DNA polymerase III subunit gamma/tau, partial [Pseudomonadota bacterium]
MSYQVLARKWRPRTFREMVGQGHVLQTLINALDNQRLHHAYLFTGTRGVGKTTIARILARCLNCETGITSNPCGECSACREINEGRFLDLIEVDAASRTKVEDTRELLENVQYAPSRGRYKVYLIDEVHMLSNHSFNALLKTLEEPPPHVKFLLATTDPQKLPVTVLSRCLQFSLKNLSPEKLVDHLKYILGQENIAFDEPALWQLGRAAQGSVRDCLTLLDQAIGFCNGKLTAAGVSDFLGNIDSAVIQHLMDALIAQDAAAALGVVRKVADSSPDFAVVLQELLSWLHRVAIAQVVPDAIDNSLGDREQVLAHAGALSGETLQLYYQIALKGREDLLLALDARSGLEMTLLRMLAFTPQTMAKAAQQKPSSDLASAGQKKKLSSEFNETPVTQAVSAVQPTPARPVAPALASPTSTERPPVVAKPMAQVPVAEAKPVVMPKPVMSA